LSADVLLFLMNILDQILTLNQQYIVYLKDYQLLENFFERFINYPNYMNLAYKIWSVCMVNEIESKEILKHSKFLFKRYNLLKDKLKITNQHEKNKKLIDELYRIYEIIQIIFLNDNFMKICSTNVEICSNNILKNIVLDFISLLSFIKPYYLSKDDGNIENNKSSEILNSHFYDFLKSFFKILNIIVVNSNKYILKERLKSIKLDSHNKIKRFNFTINKKEMKEIFVKFFIFFKDDKQTLLEVLKFFFEISLHLTDNMFILSDISPRNSDHDLLSFIKDKIKYGSNLSENVSNLSNIIIENPMVIKYSFCSIMKIGQKDLILSFLDCIVFLMKLNSGNINILLSRNFLKYLLQIMNRDSNILYEKVIEIINISFNFFSAPALEEVFHFILHQINRNPLSLTKLVDLMNENIYRARKVKRSLILSNYVIKQPNIFNIIYTGNLKLNYSKYKDTNKKMSSLSIYVSFSYKNYDKIFKNESFIIFRLEREEKNKEISLEAVIENNQLIVKENEKDFFSSSDLLGMLKSGKNVNLIFIINKDVNLFEIYLNEKFLCSVPTELKSFDFNCTYNLISGFSGNSLKELSSDVYHTFPYVNLSYFMIYADKLTSEKMIYFKLSHITNSSK
jgi:hypothetical protein